jgi:hypothetical protein
MIFTIVCVCNGRSGRGVNFPRRSTSIGDSILKTVTRPFTVHSCQKVDIFVNSWMFWIWNFSDLRVFPVLLLVFRDMAWDIAFFLSLSIWETAFYDCRCTRRRYLRASPESTVWDKTGQSQNLSLFVCVMISEQKQQIKMYPKLSKEKRMWHPPQS